jgi:transposase InsO family protein
MTACDLLYDRVSDHRRAHGQRPGVLRAARGHPYELLLGMEGIAHRTTRVATPRTNGFVERMNRTLLDECFRVAGRTTWYLEPAEIQRDLDAFLELYNHRRSHQGYRLGGRTPATALCEALAIDGEPPSLAGGFIVAEGEEATAPVAA